MASSKNYNILDIRVEENYDINFDKSKVINKAFEEAFKVLIYKLVESKDRSKIKNIPLKDKKNLIENFSINNEQFINNNYIEIANEILETILTLDPNLILPEQFNPKTSEFISAKKLSAIRPL